MREALASRQIPWERGIQLWLHAIQVDMEH